MSHRRNMNTFNFLDDLLEHVYQKEIWYVNSATDIPAVIEVGDIFKSNINQTYLKYIISSSQTKGFVELSLSGTDTTLTQKETQTEAKAYLAEVMTAEDSDSDTDSDADSDADA